MKKLIIIILCITNLSLFAQEKSFDIGVNADFGTSFLYHHHHLALPKPNITFSPLVGFSFVYNSAKNFSIMTDLNYENKGWTDKVVFTDNTGQEIGQETRRISFHSISLSLMPGFITNGKTKFFLNAGPSFNYLIQTQKSNNTPFGYYTLGLDLKLGIQKQFTDKLKINIFLQNRLDIYQRVALSMNSVLIGAGVYYKLNKK